MGYRASASKGGKSKTGKGQGQSAAAKHAYHLRADGYAVGRDGPREDLAASGHGHMPAFAADDPPGFWLASDSFERANGTLFRELQLNLPSELTLAQQQEVLKSYCARLFDAERLPHSWAIHRHTNGGEPVLGENDHAHLMVSETMTDDFSRPAAQHFKRYNPKRPEAGGAKKTRSLKPKAWLMEARAAWAEEVNRGLVAAGHKPRFDHRSKNVRQGEALRLGDLREAARLDTPTQTHEGPRIAGMRRRVEAKKVALDDLPHYAQKVIEKNDRVRQLASEWLVQVEQMTDAELAEHFADELSPGGHVAAWMGAQHAQAHEDNRQRDVAAAIAAGELELLGLAQAEAAERATELAELIEQEQNDQQTALLAIEREQVHGAALVEWVARARARVIELRPAAVRPPAVDRAYELRRQADQAAAEANATEQARQRWRQEHPFRSAAADALRIPLDVDRTAQQAKQRAASAAQALRSAPELQPTAEWQRVARELRAIEQQLPAMERAAGLEPMHEQEARCRELLNDAARNMRRALGLIENHLTWRPYEERELLHALRRDLDREQLELEQFRQALPSLSEAARVRENAAQRLEQVEGWGAAQDAAMASAKPAPNPRQQLMDGLQHAERPRSRGPRGPGL